jgi:hypothetical protein
MHCLETGESTRTPVSGSNRIMDGPDSRVHDKPRPDEADTKSDNGNTMRCSKDSVAYTRKAWKTNDN